MRLPARKRIPPLILMLILVFSYVSNGQSYESTVSNNSQFPYSVSFLKTANQQYSAADILSLYQMGKFQPSNESIINGGIARRIYWVHFALSNKENRSATLIIEIDNSRLNELELFEQTGGELRSLGKLGDFYPFAQRVNLHKNFIYKPTLEPNQKKEFFLQVKQVGHAFVLPINVYKSKDFESTTFRDYLIDGVTYGILLFVAIISLLFFLTSKHLLYLYYSLYVITAICWFLGYFGLGYQYLWGNYPWLNTAMAPAMAALNIFFNIQICQVLLKLYKSNRRINMAAIVVKTVLLLLVIIPFVGNLNARSYTVNHTYLLSFLSSILIAMIFVSGTIVYYAIKGQLAAKFYLAASVLKAGSIIYLAFLELGIADAYSHMEGMLQIGIFVEIFLLTYALALRYTNYRVKTFVKVIEAHEKERFSLSQEIHDGISSALTGIRYKMKNLLIDSGQLPENKKHQFEEIYENIHKVQLEARSIFHNTMPDYIKDKTLTDITKEYIDGIQNKLKTNANGSSYIKIDFSANEQVKKFSDSIKLNVYRIIQEIVINILKHSQATVADILISFDKRNMTIIAEDNGIGFVENEKKEDSGQGLSNIRSRASLLNGRATIKSKMKSNKNDNGAEQGTLITIKIPYRNNSFTNRPDNDY